jgi:hypothetical protein
MDRSIRLRILDKVVEAIEAPEIVLDGVTHAKPERLTVARERLQEMEDTESLPIALVYIDEETGERVGGRRGPITAREFDVVVEVLAQVPRTEDPADPRKFVNEAVEDVTDPLLSWVQMAVMKDERLGGLADSIAELGTTWESDFAEVAIAGAGVRFTIAYHTRLNNLTRRA